MTQKKIRVGVIMAGISSEKEVSLESGRNIVNKMDKNKYEAFPLFMDKNAGFWLIPLKLLLKNSTSDIEDELAESAQRISYEELREKIDLAFLGVHGKFGEDGCLQGLLELLGVPYTGSGVLSSALGMDKLASRKIFAINGLDVPMTIAVEATSWKINREAEIQKISKDIPFPCVVKPSREGCSTAVAKVLSREELIVAVDSALLWDSVVLVEEFIEGIEVTCGVIGDDEPLALVPSETIPTKSILSLEDKFLYGQGENKTPARVSAATILKIQETAVAAFRTLALKGYARIDMFVRQNGSVAVLEPNTLPGMTPSTVLFHQAAEFGITQSELLDKIINSALKVHAEKKGPL
ncbi:MAG: D-alanine--D-alanine ligase [Deltaproteobacteria bacterium]|nr:D-alanine--D-alanine ligase [Deltaproteobacteria bacterium]